MTDKTQPRRRRATLGAALAVCWALSGCGVQAVRSDGAITQVIQETREQLRAEPGAKRQEVLFLNNAAALLTSTGDDMRGPSARGDTTPGAASELAARYAEACSLALDARLALSHGDQAEAERLLTRSLERYPTAVGKGCTSRGM
jgi:hypothetical protein